MSRDCDHFIHIRMMLEERRRIGARQKGDSGLWKQAAQRSGDRQAEHLIANAVRPDENDIRRRKVRDSRFEGRGFIRSSVRVVSASHSTILLSLKLEPFFNCSRTASTTVFGSIAVKHSSGMAFRQVRLKQGLQGMLLVNTRCAEPYGPVRRGLVGPKRAITGVFIAAAICIG